MDRRPSELFEEMLALAWRVSQRSPYGRDEAGNVICLDCKVAQASHGERHTPDCTYIAMRRLVTEVSARERLAS